MGLYFANKYLTADTVGIIQFRETATRAKITKGEKTNE